ncbi:MAG TPA: TIGR01777 family oxidoreductase [Thermoleophilaceae bacterium]|jgi:hypothetical protein|nr:TIGR01777 family oxidoreductase [Thermoleophilaceae bacterium]
MRVAVTGATGMIGGAIVDALRARGDEVTVLSRSTNWPAPKEEPPPAETLRGQDAVVNLLGENIDQRWSDEAKAEIRDSRVLGTRNLVAGLRALPEAERPRVLVSQSGVGYYGARGDEVVTEDEPAGDDFLARVCSEWEAEALAASADGVRVVIPRTGVVLSPSGGALARMLPFFKAGLGGPIAGGRQYMPWVHQDDLPGVMLFAIDTQELSGPVNLTAPEPVTNKEFARALGRVLHRPTFAPVPGAMMKLLYGERSLFVITGQRAVPAKLEQAGYAFRQPELDAALRAVTG